MRKRFCLIVKKAPLRVPQPKTLMETSWGMQEIRIKAALRTPQPKTPMETSKSPTVGCQAFGKSKKVNARPYSPLPKSSARR